MRRFTFSMMNNTRYIGISHMQRQVCTLNKHSTRKDKVICCEFIMCKNVYVYE